MNTPLQGVKRVTLRVENKMNWVTLQQGEPEQLEIEADPDVLARIEVEVAGDRLTISNAGSWTDRLRDALSTSLTRQQVTYRLAVRDLTQLKVGGMARVDMAELETEQLALQLHGACQMSIGQLAVRDLDVDLRGSGRVTLSGYSRRQRISVEGMVAYEAGKLRSEQTTVDIRGAGRATVWANDTLDIAIRGMGRVAYRGQPAVRQQVMPMGIVTALEPARVATPYV
jgi:hypothetical protein